MGNTKNVSLQPHAAIDVTKLIMAFLVVAIHVEPFGFSFWLDKGFGIITRVCVPFFFIASSYFFFLKNGSALHYVKRLFILYFVWSVIYLPFSIPRMEGMSVAQILKRYLWSGNGHALWYLCGSIVGFLITYGLSKVMSPKKVFYIAVAFLVVGTLKSTYAPLFESVFQITIKDYIGSRNGLFYAFAYYALGLVIAKSDDSQTKSLKKNVIGFFVSMVFLIVESVIFVWWFKTRETTLWISALPLTYNFFMIVKNIKLPISDKKSVFCRKLSTLIYVSHCFFMYLLSDLQYWVLFLAVSLLSIAFGVLIICLSKTRWFKWLKFIY